MPSTTVAVRAANDRLRQENMLLQQRVDELEASLDRVSTQYAKVLGVFDRIEAEIKLVRWTPTKNVMDEGAGW